MRKYRAVRIQVDFADGSKLVAEGDEAETVWSRLEAADQIMALHSNALPVEVKVEPLLRLILPNGEEVKRS